MASISLSTRSCNPGYIRFPPVRKTFSTSAICCSGVYLHEQKNSLFGVGQRCGSTCYGVWGSLICLKPMPSFNLLFLLGKYFFNIWKLYCSQTRRFFNNIPNIFLSSRPVIAVIRQNKSYWDGTKTSATSLFRRKTFDTPNNLLITRTVASASKWKKKLCVCIFAL